MRAAILVLIVCQLGAARADERAVSREHYVKGTKAFDLGLYEDAIRELMAAYQAKDDPALLYNIGQAHRLAGHAPEALRFYRVYLTKLPHAPNREDVELKIAELYKAIEQQKKTQTQLPPDQVLKPAAPLPDAPAKVETESAPAFTHAPPPVSLNAPRPPPATLVTAPPPGTRRLKIAGIATAGAGVALVAVGVGMAVLASQTADAISRSPRFDAAQLDAYETYQRLEGALLGIGAAAMVSGAVVYAVGWQRSRSPRLTVAPAAMRGGGLVTVFGTF